MAASAETNQQHERFAARREQVLGVLRQRGGTASRHAIVEALGVSPATVARTLEVLVGDESIERVAKGTYRLTGESSGLSPRAEEIVRALREGGVEAHLTGLDLLSGHAHQYTRAFPHLVYADPESLEQVAFVLSQAGFQPVSPGRHLRNLLVHSPDLDRVVVLRGQPPGRMTRFGVHSEVAPPEKAWLDLLRETKAENLPFSWGEVGAILAAVLLVSFDTERLQSWAREMGYEQFVRAVLDDSPVLDSPALQELRAGAAR